MSKIWYPVIDYAKCTECGTCVNKCSHGVYNKEKHPTPVVIYPEGCLDGCHGCGNLCPQMAITYVGEIVKEDNKGCNCDQADAAQNCQGGLCS